MARYLIMGAVLALVACGGGVKDTPPADVAMEAYAEAWPAQQKRRFIGSCDYPQNVRTFARNNGTVEFSLDGQLATCENYYAPVLSDLDEGIPAEQLPPPPQVEELRARCEQGNPPVKAVGQWHETPCYKAVPERACRTRQHGTSSKFVTSTLAIVDTLYYGSDYTSEDVVSVCDMGEWSQRAVYLGGN